MASISKKIINSIPELSLSDKKTDLNIFPDFLIVGPQRTGTTWLAHNIKYHPQIFFSQPKELFFFDLLSKPSHPLYTSNDLTWYLKHFENKDWFNKQKWAIKNYGEFYCPKMRGEGTANYAAMSLDLIENIVKLNPNIKAIIMVRNPIKRAWAHAKKDLLNKSLINDTPRELHDISDN